MKKYEYTTITGSVSDTLRLHRAIAAHGRDDFRVVGVTMAYLLFRGVLLHYVMEREVQTP